MHGKDAIRNAYEVGMMVLTAYFEDFTDEELLQRPGEGCNNVAWQLGHLISSEYHMVEAVVPGSGIQLPDDFAEKHSKENCASDDPGDFLSKAEYLELFARMKEATFAALDSQTDEDLAKPAPEFLQAICPNAGAVFVLIATHGLMHAGQLVPIRRRLGKPIKM